jgi:hypothetical protein
MNEQQLAAVKLALEALELHGNQYPHMVKGYCLDAITALQSIISQDALDKMAENARAFGLDYEPAVQEGRDWPLLEATQESLREHMAEIKRLKAAQPAPVQEPVAWMYESVCGNDFAIRHDPPDYAKNIRPLYITPPAPQPVPVKTYSGGKPWPVAPAPDPAPIIQQLVTALEGSGTRMRSDQWYVEIEAVAAGKFYLNSKGEGL